MAELEELMSESIEDHRLTKEILGELSGTYEVDDFNDLLEELMDTVEDHVAEEEDEVFPRVIEMLSDREWDQLALAMLERREGLRAA
jgi:hemerythrin superfamily protein